MSTAPREPKNGQARATTIRPMITQRWVDGRVSLWLTPAGRCGRPGEACQAAVRRARNSCQKNIATAQAAMVHSTAGLAPWTSSLMPTVVSFRPSTG
ncbi:hypothetical protein D9M68_778900 [compost metagenome]